MEFANVNTKVLRLHLPATQKNVRHLCIMTHMNSMLLLVPNMQRFFFLFELVWNITYCPHRFSHTKIPDTTLKHWFKIHVTDVITENISNSPNNKSPCQPIPHIPN